MNRFKRVWFGKGDMRPEFRPSGLALDRVQFCYRNVVGQGAFTKRGAVINWFKQVRQELNR